MGHCGFIKGIGFSVRTDRVWFLLTWTCVCVSLYSGIGRLVLVVDCQVLKDDIHHEATETSKIKRPKQFRMKLGYGIDGDAVVNEFS